MRGSDTYEAILEEGEARGYAKAVIRGKQGMLLVICSKKFGPPTPAVREAIIAISDSQKIDSLAERVLDVSSWDELF